MTKGYLWFEILPLKFVTKLVFIFTDLVVTATVDVDSAYQIFPDIFSLFSVIFMSCENEQKTEQTKKNRWELRLHTFDLHPDIIISINIFGSFRIVSSIISVFMQECRLSESERHESDSHLKYSIFNHKHILCMFRMKWCCPPTCMLFLILMSFCYPILCHFLVSLFIRFIFLLLYFFWLLYWWGESRVWIWNE